MKADGWRCIIDKATDSEKEMLSELLEQLDQAMQELRGKGYGHTGLSILETVKLIPDSE